MFARVSTYRADDPVKLVESFEHMREPLEQIEGFSHAYFLMDRAGDKAMSITLWESEAALMASVRQADELRKRGTEMVGGSIESVEHYEVGLTARSRTTA